MKINNAHRAAVVRAWRDARAHGEDQASFCARQVPPIRPRTLRQWTKTLGPAISGVEPGSDLRLVQAALANLHLLADLLDRARLDVPLRHDADPGSASRASSNDQTGAIIKPGLPTGTPAVPTEETAPRRGAGFWDE